MAYEKSTSVSKSEPVKIEITSRGFGAVNAASILNHPNVKDDLAKSYDDLN